MRSERAWGRDKIVRGGADWPYYCWPSSSPRSGAGSPGQVAAGINMDALAGQLQDEGAK
jgi:hypothetical protein